MKKNNTQTTENQGLHRTGVFVTFTGLFNPVATVILIMMLPSFKLVTIHEYVGLSPGMSTTSSMASNVLPRATSPKLHLVSSRISTRSECLTSTESVPPKEIT